MKLPSSLLVIHLGAIGDVVHGLVVAAAVKDAEPEARLGWVAHPLVAPLVEGHPCIDRVHVWEDGGGLAGFMRIVRALRRERYQLAVDLQRMRKSAFLSRLSGATRAFAYDHRHEHEQGGSSRAEKHMVQRYLEVASDIGCAAPVARHLLPRDAAAERWAEERIRVLGGAPILVHLGASKPEHRWDPELFGSLARMLAEQQELPVCLTGGPADRVRVVAGIAISPRVHDLVGASTLAQFVALARRARLFIGGDTGPMHIAAAVGTPVVALFGPTDPARSGPWGTGHRVIRSPSRSMEGIGVEQVRACAREQLGLVHV